MVFPFLGFTQNTHGSLKASINPSAVAQFLGSSVKADIPLQRTCGTMDYLAKMKSENPSLENDMAQQEQRLQNFITQNYDALTQQKATYTIPVVVHVIYKNQTQNISDAQVASQITVLNNDFQKLNSDVNQVPSAWTSLVADVSIQFCLATKDPQGNATNGITRTSTPSNTVFDPNSENMKHTNTGGKDAWPTDQYLNIWVCDLGSGLLGYAQFPGTGSAATDGVVIGYFCYGTTGTAQSPYNLGRTATHEVGHWLGLYHIWGDEPACAQDDNVTDTPKQKDKNYGCPSFPQGSNADGGSCTGSTPGSMFMNYMDYVNDACMHFFTNGQKARVIAALTQQRAPLLTSQGCSGSVPPNPGSCDSITNVLASQQLQLYAPSDLGVAGEGWVSGTNNFLDKAKADKYTAPVNNQIKGMWVYIAALYSPGNGSSTVSFKVWNNSGTGGSPGTAIGSQNVTTLNIYNNIMASQMTYAQFPSMLTHNGTFYAGVEFDPTNGDTIGIVTNTYNEAANTGWELNSANNWIPYSDNNVGWGISMSHVIMPVLCAPTTTSSLSYPPNQFDMEIFPNPANDMLYISISNEVVNHESVAIKVLNLLGQEVIHKNVLANSSTLNVDLAGVDQGIYILQVTQNDKVSIKKFQVTR